jgi:hypothetical protein
MSLPSKNPVSPSVLREDVGKLLGTDFSTADFDELRNELASAGFLTKGKRNIFTLTDVGRERALRFLGATELPPELNWSTAIAKYLFPKAAGLSDDAAAELKSSDKLAAFILKRKYDLGAGAGSTVNQVLEALVCKNVGFGEETTLEGLLCAVLSRLMGSQRLSRDDLAKQFPQFETGLTVVDAAAARNKVVRDWLGVKPRKQPEPAQAGLSEPERSRPELAAPEHSPPEPFDLPAFAATVHALAAKSPADDRFHHNKVFIAPLWRATQDEPNFPRLSLPEFKQRLIEANSQDLLQLSRADLVSAMDPQLVAESETAHSNSTFHFVLLEEHHREQVHRERADLADRPGEATPSI